MFISAAIAAAVTQVVATQQIWWAEYEKASPERKAVMLAERERQYQAAMQERRHQETLQAVRDSNDGPGFGMGFILGLICGK